MREHVTIVPEDNGIFVDNEYYEVEIADLTENIHAIQWHKGKGQIEYDNPDEEITIKAGWNRGKGIETVEVKAPVEYISGEEDYNKYIAHYVELWEQKKKEVEEQEKQWLEIWNSEPEKAKRIRKVRNTKIAETDYAVLPDYTIDEEKLTAIKTYRQALRDFPTVEGFPWSGDPEDETIPWPEKPEI